jgi:cold-inducible RNA-binding protein
MNIYVKNLPPAVRTPDLQAFFAPFGSVKSAEVITNMKTGEPLGYGFVMMSTEQEADAAIAQLNGKVWMGKTLIVEKANRVAGKRKRQQFQRGSPGREQA